MHWNTSIDIYCERTSSAFLAEPLNFVSNLAFLAVAILLHRKLRSESYPAALHYLVYLIYFIALGSGLFHSVATFWTIWADVVPIGIFLFAYLGLWMKLAGWNGVRCSLGYLGFIALSLLLAKAVGPQKLNGSESYLGALVTLGAIAAYTKHFRWPTASRYMNAWVLFLLSFGLRSIDIRSCPIFPIGTHFFWHLLNAIVLWLLMTAALTKANKGGAN